MERVAKAVGFKLTAHAFRRYAATSLAELNMPVEKIMMYLGHTSIRTTLIYINSCSPKLLEGCTNQLESMLDGVDY